MKTEVSKIVSVFLSKAAQVISTASLTFIVAKMLGPAANGEFSLAILAVNLIAMFSSFGLPTSVNYFLVKRGNPAITLDCFALQIIAFCLVLPLALSAILVIQTEISYNLLVIISVFSFSKVIVSFYQGVYFGTFRFEKYSLMLVLHSLLLLLVIVSVSRFYNLTTNEILIVQSVSYLILTFFLFRLPSKFSIKSLNTSSFSEILVFGMKSYFNNLIAFLTYRVDLMIVSIYLSMEHVGLYSLSVSILEGLGILTASIVSVYFNKLVKDLTFHLVLKVICISLALAILTILVFRYFILEDIVLFLGEGFEPLKELIELLLYTLAITSVTKVLAMTFVSRNKQSFNTYSAITMFVIASILSVILVPKLGLQGAVIANLSGNIINLIIKVIQLKKLYVT